MFTKFILISLIATGSSIYGMHNFAPSPVNSPSLTKEQREQQEKDAYDNLHALVQKRIANKEDLNQPIASDDFFKKTPLHKACGRGDSYLPITRLLLAHGADPNAQESDGEAPLFRATNELALETVTLLLNSSAHPNCMSHLNTTPLQRLCYSTSDEVYHIDKAKKRIQIARLLLKYGRNSDSICSITTNGCLHSLIARAYQNLDSINALDSEEKRNLFFKQRRGLIRALLEYGASLNICNSSGNNPIQAAYLEGIKHHQANQAIYHELAQYALNYSTYLRNRLLLLIGHSGTRAHHETPFRILPRDVINIIIDLAYPRYQGPQFQPQKST